MVSITPVICPIGIRVPSSLGRAGALVDQRGPTVRLTHELLSAVSPGGHKLPQSQVGPVSQGYQGVHRFCKD